MPQDNSLIPPSNPEPQSLPQSVSPMGNTATSPSTVVTSSQTSKKYGKKKIIATIFAFVALVLGVGTAVTVVQKQQITTGFAWDCSKYVFEVTKDGTVTVRNGSTRNEPAQKAEVFINNVLVKTFDVPALTAGQAATLGTVTVPTTQGFTWLVDGTVDCKNSGQHTGSTPTPTTPQISASCSAVKAYDLNWNQLSTSDLAKLKSGDKVRFAVSGTASGGSFDKARFTINGTQRPEVTTKKPGTEEYYDEYTIPNGTLNFSTSAQVHHSSLGWF